MELLHQRGFITRFFFRKLQYAELHFLLYGNMLWKYVDFKSRSRNVWYQMVFFDSLQYL